MDRLIVLALAALGCRGGTAQPPDAPPDDDVSTTCTDACEVTELTAMFQTTRVLDRAVFGINTADSTLHVEAYGGGAAGCPSETSPTPDYTLVLGKVAMPTGTAPTMSPGNVLDFVGDLLGGELGAQAHIVLVNAVAAAENLEFIALDLYLEFIGGTLSGHLYATHCDSLDSA
jgi:hypothetical protein